MREKLVGREDRRDRRQRRGQQSGARGTAAMARMMNTGRAAPIARITETARMAPAVLILVTLVLPGLGGCSRSREEAPLPARTTWIDESKLVDLTHPFDSSTIYWPTNQPFRLSRVAWGTTPGGWWYASNDYSASEHGGTHTDAPIHFHEGRWTADQTPIDRLVGPAVVLDVRTSCEGNPDYVATEDDLAAWEKANGPLPEGAIVILMSGWEDRWPDRLRYLGSDRAGDVEGLHFPGFSEGLARKLTIGGGETGGRVAGAGLGTASLD